MAEKIASSLRKVYHNKRVAVQLRIDGQIAWRADAGDLTELPG